MTDTLFDDQPRARRDGPETSKLSAKQIGQTARNQQMECMAAVARWPGRTMQELVANANAVWKNETPATAHIYSRRLPELRNKGYVRNGPTRACKVTRRQAMTWEPIPETESKK